MQICMNTKVNKPDCDHREKAWEMRRETEADGRHDISIETHLKPQPSISKVGEYNDFLAGTAPRNMSELKLMNGSFANLDQQEGNLTRSQSTK